MDAVAFAVAGEYRVAAVVFVNVRRVGAENNFRVEILIDKVAQEHVAARVGVFAAGAWRQTERAVNHIVGVRKIVYIGCANIVVALNQICDALGEKFRHGIFNSAAGVHHAMNHFVRQNPVNIYRNVETAVGVVGANGTPCELIEIKTNFDSVIGRVVVHFALGICNRHVGRVRVEVSFNSLAVETHAVRIIRQLDGGGEPLSHSFGNSGNVLQNFFGGNCLVAVAKNLVGELGHSKAVGEVTDGGKAVLPLDVESNFRAVVAGDGVGTCRTGFGKSNFRQRSDRFGNNIFRVENFGTASLVAARRAGIFAVQNNIRRILKPLRRVAFGLRNVVNEIINRVSQIAVQGNRFDSLAENFHAVGGGVFAVPAEHAEEIFHDVDAGVKVADFKFLAVDDNGRFRRVLNRNCSFVGGENDVAALRVGFGDLRDNVGVAGVVRYRIAASARHYRIVFALDNYQIVAAASLNAVIGAVAVNRIVPVASTNHNAAAGICNFVVAAACVNRHVIAAVLKYVVHIASSNFHAAFAVEKLVGQVGAAGIERCERALRAADNEIGAAGLNGGNFFNFDLRDIVQTGNGVAAVAENNHGFFGVA